MITQCGNCPFSLSDSGVWFLVLILFFVILLLLFVCVFVFVNLTQDRIIWQEGISTEKMLIQIFPRYVGGCIFLWEDSVHCGWHQP